MPNNFIRPVPKGDVPILPSYLQVGSVVALVQRESVPKGEVVGPLFKLQALLVRMLMLKMTRARYQSKLLRRSRILRDHRVIVRPCCRSRVGRCARTVARLCLPVKTMGRVSC